MLKLKQIFFLSTPLLLFAESSLAHFSPPKNNPPYSSQATTSLERAFYRLWQFWAFKVLWTLQFLVFFYLLGAIMPRKTEDADLLKQITIFYYLLSFLCIGAAALPWIFYNKFALHRKRWYPHPYPVVWIGLLYIIWPLVVIGTIFMLLNWFLLFILTASSSGRSRKEIFFNQTVFIFIFSCVSLIIYSCCFYPLLLLDEFCYHSYSAL